MKKRSPAKFTQYDWLINYVPEFMKKWWMVLKIKL